MLSGSQDRPSSENPEWRSLPRRAPRVSLIVVLPQNHTVSADRLAEGLRAHGGQQVDVVIACAGEPSHLEVSHVTVGDAQVLVAPSGTTIEDLRELAMRRAAGDIVTLLCGDPVSESCTGATTS